MPKVTDMLAVVLGAYLDEKAADYERQPHGARTPTVPALAGEGKVNVRGIAEALVERDERVRPSHEQHLFKAPELRLMVNAVAAKQGLRGIGSRQEAAADGEVAAVRIDRLESDASRVRQALSEREAIIERLRAENAMLRAQLRMLEETGMVVRTGDVV